MDFEEFWKMENPTGNCVIYVKSKWSTRPTRDHLPIYKRHESNDKTRSARLSGSELPSWRFSDCSVGWLKNHFFCIFFGQRRPKRDSTPFGCLYCIVFKKSTSMTKQRIYKIVATAHGSISNYLISFYFRLSTFD